MSSRPRGRRIPDAAPSLNVTATEKACDRDRAWFVANPGATEYVRRAVANEAPGVRPGDLVRVVQIAPGLRARLPFDDKRLRHLVLEVAGGAR